MSFKRAAVAFGMLAALAACGQPSSSETEAAAEPEPAVDVLAQYSIPNFTVTEFRAVSDPGKVCVAIDGAYAGDIDCWKLDAIESGIPGILAPYDTRTSEILAHYGTREGEVVEFRPASDPLQTCFAIDGAYSGGLKCLPN